MSRSLKSASSSHAEPLDSMSPRVCHHGLERCLSVSAALWTHGAGLAGRKLIATASSGTDARKERRVVTFPPWAAKSAP